MPLTITYVIIEPYSLNMHCSCAQFTQTTLHTCICTARRLRGKIIDSFALIRYSGGVETEVPSVVNPRGLNQQHLLHI